MFGKNLIEVLNVSEKDKKMLTDIEYQTRNEGWGIYQAFGSSTGDEFRIERHDLEGKFKDDEEAIEFVVLQAILGSEPHKNTIKFFVKYGSESEVKIILNTLAK